MRFIRGIALLAILLCGCGGGGGGGGGGGLTADQQAAITLLETCGVSTIDRFLEALGISVAIVDPNATTLPPMQVMNADQMNGIIQWQLNLGGDPAPEFIGLVQFANDLNQPAEPPFDLTQFVAAGLSTLDQFLDQLPDGWTVSISANAPLDPPINSRFVYEYTSGAVSEVSGNANVQSGACGTIFILAGAALADLAGLFPTADFMTTYGGNGTSLDGTTAFDGTAVALADGVVNGGTTTYTFAVDLVAGTVTAVP